MTLDNFGLKARGNVCAELYDPVTGDILDVIYRRNIVTINANAILAGLVSNPMNEVRYTKSAVLDTASVPDGDGFYRLNLPLARCSRRYVELVPGAATYELVADKPIYKLVKVVKTDGVNSTVLAIGSDVRLVDEDAGKLVFKDQVGTVDNEKVQVDYLEVTNSQVRIIEGSESVKVGVTDFSRSWTGAPSDADNTYIIDYDTGEISFETAKAGVQVSFDYKQVAGISHMGVSNKPDTHPAGVPIIFTDADKAKVALDAEYPGCRQPVIFPATVTVGTETSEVKNSNGTVNYALNSNNVPLLELISVTHSNGTVYNIRTASTTDPNCVWIADASIGAVEFSTAPPAGTITFKYRWNSGTTVTFVADFPQGVPGAEDAQRTDIFNAVGGANTTYVLTYPVKVDTTPAVLVNGVSLAPDQWSLSEDRRIVTILITLLGTETITVNYIYDKTFADIYEVGLFNRLSGGDMFAISGIGPITKDINVGMRVTWSITFLRESK
ncbi:MAG: hypothetical protein AB1330_01315 [Bacillota bacterium]